MKSLWPAVCLAAAVGFPRITDAKPDKPGKTPSPAIDPMLGKEAGEVRDDNGLKLKLVWCPRGSLTMEELEPVGDFDPNDRAARRRALSNRKVTPVKVSLTHGYWIGKYEVTQSEWKQLMKTEPWKHDQRAIRMGTAKEGADYPATYVNWDDATDFCDELTKRERQAGRLSNEWEYTLPTEAQWEHACRAGTETKFSFGDDASKFGEYAWFINNAMRAGEQYAHRVGEKKPNRWGLHDMYGNVWEWCRDVYTEKLPGGRDPEVTPDDAPLEKRDARDWHRVIRGSAWPYAPKGSAYRMGGLQRWSTPSGYDDLGFRLALSAVRQDKTLQQEADGHPAIDK
jgi:formylglycine-generating enzyme required for sulfatase activity